MHVAKPAASLTAGLLAQRGHARPAMRRTTVSGLTPATATIEDLGWNDMGEDAIMSPPVDSSPVASQIATLNAELLGQPDEGIAMSDTIPSIEAEATATGPAPRLTPAGRKAAFTLRLDAERHLRLRLLSAVTNLSAQQLLIAALDRLLDDHPNIDALAGCPKARELTQLPWNGEQQP